MADPGQATESSSSGSEQTAIVPTDSSPVDSLDPPAGDTKAEQDGTLAEDEEAQLAAIAAGVHDQDDLEGDIGRQADQMLLEQADERDQKRLDKTKKEKAKLRGRGGTAKKMISAVGIEKSFSKGW